MSCISQYDSCYHTWVTKTCISQDFYFVCVFCRIMFLQQGFSYICSNGCQCTGSRLGMGTAFADVGISVEEREYFRVVRPSVRSLKYPLFTCIWVCCSTRPTVTVLRHVRPSVRPERFPGIRRRTHGGNSLKFYMLMYRDHLQNWLVYGHGLLIFLILALFWLSATGQIWGFGHFPENAWRKWTEIFAHWCILTTFRTEQFMAKVCWFS